MDNPISTSLQFSSEDARKRFESKVSRKSLNDVASFLQSITDTHKDPLKSGRFVFKDLKTQPSEVIQKLTSGKATPQDVETAQNMLKEYKEWRIKGNNSDDLGETGEVGGQIETNLAILRREAKTQNKKGEDVAEETTIDPERWQNKYNQVQNLLYFYYNWPLLNFENDQNAETVIKKLTQIVSEFVTSSNTDKKNTAKTGLDALFQPYR